MNRNNAVKIKALAYEVEPVDHITVLDPDLCTPWHLSNRAPEHVTEQSCFDLIESIKASGQQIPVLVRKNKTKEGYELICGVRRLFACKYLGLKLRATITDLSDKDALLAMDAENRQREDISPYERACDYRQWVDSGIYKNYSEIIADLGVKKSWFSQLVALADLPKEIVAAFGHPINLKQKWGYELQLRCKKNSRLESAMVLLAKELTAKSTLPAVVYKRLMNVLTHEDNFIRKDSILITDAKAEAIFEVKYSSSGKARLLFTKAMKDSLIEKIIQLTKTLIEESSD